MNLMSLKWVAQPGDLTRVFDAEKARGGDESLRLDAGIAGNFLCSFPSDMRDLSSCEWLHFWAFSEEETGALIAVQFISPGENGVGDSYLARFCVDWTGWKEINLSWDEFKSVGNPAGWNSITRLQLITYYFKPPKPGTILYLSDIRLTAENPESELGRK